MQGLTEKQKERMKQLAESELADLPKRLMKNGAVIEMMNQAHADPRFKRMVDVLPESSHGTAAISHFTVDPATENFSRMRALFNPDRRWHEYIIAGRYAKLTINDKVFMTDTAHEKISAIPFLDKAHGHVLVAGLGIGMVLPPLLDDPMVDSVTVIENNADVIDLVGPHFKDRRLEIVHADIWTWKPKCFDRFDTVFHDIWPSIDWDNLPEMNRLKRRYRRYMNKENPKRWQWCWSEDLCRALKREWRQKKREIEKLQAAVGGDPLRELA